MKHVTFLDRGHYMHSNIIIIIIINVIIEKKFTTGSREGLMQVNRAFHSVEKSRVINVYKAATCIADTYIQRYYFKEIDLHLMCHIRPGRLLCNNEFTRKHTRFGYKVLLVSLILIM